MQGNLAVSFLSLLFAIKKAALIEAAFGFISLQIRALRYKL